MLLNDLGLSPILGQSVEEHLATSLLIGSIQAHTVPGFDPKEDISKRSFKDSSGKSLTLANPQSAEAIQSNNIKKVTNVNEAKKLVLQMDLKNKEVIKFLNQQL